MTSVPSQSPTTGRSRPISDFEPDDEWKKQLRLRIEDGLRDPVDSALKKYTAAVDSAENDAARSTAQTKYDEEMRNIRGKAQEEYNTALRLEILDRQLTVGQKPDEPWSEQLLKEQQILWRKLSKGEDASSSTRVSESPLTANAG